MEKQISYIQEWISLSLVPGLGVSGYWRLLDYLNSPSNVLQASQKELNQIPGIQKRQIAGLISRDAILQRGVGELEKLASLGAQAISFDDPAYPTLLRQIADPPPVIYISGKKELLLKDSVAMVGSRAATVYGRRTAYSLAENLTRFSLLVVSGLALGIDAEAHRGCLAAGGETIAVLGCGLDIVYPRQNRDLYQEISDQGVLVSEYPLGTQPEGFRFPARNRIIAGLSKGVVVVEAAKRSGSLITAQLALDYGREVFAVPGQVDSHKSAGAHWLLQQGAKLVQRVEDIIDEFPGGTAPQVAATHSEEKGRVAYLEPDAEKLLSLIEPYPRTRDQLLDNSGLSPARMSELLLFLELEELVEVLPGDKICKTTG
ncbi:MAG: DNA-protecting protein DprA [Deltaproteobacteria bacterium]|nr:DNA-protecting protein DprA [Deltaproteobacteria bacterium]